MNRIYKDALKPWQRIVITAPYIMFAIIGFTWYSTDLYGTPLIGSLILGTANLIGVLVQLLIYRRTKYRSDLWGVWFLALIAVATAAMTIPNHH